MKNIVTTVYTVGHSNHPSEKFIDLLITNGITAIADVRSTPFSRRNPQFNRDELATALKKHAIEYVFLGKELGARSNDPSCYANGKVQYGRLAETSLFKAGIERVLQGAKKYRVALMCAEKEPLDCHRTLLVSRALTAQGAIIMHLMADASIEPHEATMSRLIERVGLAHNDLFQDETALINEACELQENKIAFATERRIEKA